MQKISKCSIIFCLFTITQQIYGMEKVSQTPSDESRAETTRIRPKTASVAVATRIRLQPIDQALRPHVHIQSAEEVALQREAREKELANALIDEATLIHNLFMSFSKKHALEMSEERNCVRNCLEGAKLWLTYNPWTSNNLKLIQGLVDIIKVKTGLSKTENQGQQQETVLLLLMKQQQLLNQRLSPLEAIQRPLAIAIWTRIVNGLPSLLKKSMRRPMEAILKPINTETPVPIVSFIRIRDALIKRFKELRLEEHIWLTPLSPRNHFYVKKEHATQQETIYIHSDLHGDVKSLMAYLRELRTKGAIDGNWNVAPGNRIIFLGDYIDRGLYGLEVLYILMKLAYNNPENVTLIRGNHEAKQMCSRYNENEILHKIIAIQERQKREGIAPDETVDIFFKKLYTFFITLPSALYLQKPNGKYILFTHGAHNHEHETLRAFLLTDKKYDTLASWNYSWNDYREELNEEIKESQRGCGFYYSQHATKEWMDVHNVERIFHGHEHTDSCLWDGRVYGLRISPDTSWAIDLRDTLCNPSEQSLRELYSHDAYGKITIQEDGPSTVEIINI